MSEINPRVVGIALGALALIAAVVLFVTRGEDAPVEVAEPVESSTTTTTEPEETTTTTTTTTTTSTIPNQPVSPLNGLALDANPTARILTVKIDNHPNARPQSGIQEADLMIEIWVEGITRFLSVWQVNDVEYLGPIRSMRPTDFSIQNYFQSTFVNSGGQGWVQAIGNNSNVNWFQEPAGSFRVGDRFAPHNLYGDTFEFRDLDGRGDYEAPLAPLWNFGPLPDSAAAATQISTDWPQGFNVSWAWNGSVYERTTEGQPHEWVQPNPDTGEAETGRVTAETLVMLEMDISSQNGGGSAVPISITTGSGKAWVFANGQYIEGTWARAADTDWFILTGADGSEMTVPAGQTWLVLARTGGVTPS